MSIDADLNAVIITSEEAKTRRNEISKEGEFYGAMYGAAKFVKGDAVAGILILVINIIGGLIIGASEKVLEVYLGPFFGGAIEGWAPYVLAIFFLLYRPEGLFGEKIIRRV